MSSLLKYTDEHMISLCIDLTCNGYIDILAMRYPTGLVGIEVKVDEIIDKRQIWLACND